MRRPISGKSPPRAAARRGSTAGGREVVVDVAVGEGQAADAPGMVGREQLRDGRAAVVRDQVDLVEPERGAEGLEHLRLGRKRDVLVLGRARPAVGQQVHRDAAAHVGDALDDVAPEMAVQEDAVHEQGGGTAAPFAIGDVSEGRGYVHCVSPSFLGWVAAGC